MSRLYIVQSECDKSSKYNTKNQNSVKNFKDSQRTEFFCPVLKFGQGQSVLSSSRGQDRTGQDRTGQDRTGQAKPGQENTGKNYMSVKFYN
jgi:hypothetical protein